MAVMLGVGFGYPCPTYVPCLFAFRASADEETEMPRAQTSNPSIACSRTAIFVRGIAASTGWQVPSLVPASSPPLRGSARISITPAKSCSIAGRKAQARSFSPLATCAVPFARTGTSAPTSYADISRAVAGHPGRGIIARSGGRAEPIRAVPRSCLPKASLDRVTRAMSVIGGYELQSAEPCMMIIHPVASRKRGRPRANVIRRRGPRNRRSCLPYDLGRQP
jgi:hypothetical protein